MLYKILDMLQYAKIPFVFLATSQKVDIVDSFEKRIKSRFSHRQVLFYEEKVEDYIAAIDKMVEDKLIQPTLEIQRKLIKAEQDIEAGKETLMDEDKIFDEKSLIDDMVHSNIMIQDLIKSELTIDFLETSFDCGKGYEYINQQLRIVLSNVDQKIRENIRCTNPAEQVSWIDRPDFMNQIYAQAIKNVSNLTFVAGEPSTVIRNLP